MSIFTKTGLVDQSGENQGLVRRPLPANAHRPLTASAMQINMTDKREAEALSARRQADKWQEEAWQYYDYITEVAFSANLVANILSRINLYAGYIEKSSMAPSEVDAVEKLDQHFKDTVNDVLYLLESGKGGTSGMLRDAALNFFVAGECYLVKVPGNPMKHTEDKYQIRSVSEIVVTPSSGQKKASLALKGRKDSKPGDLSYVELPSDTYKARLWRSHPQWSDEADSSLRSLLEICDSLLLLERTINASSKSKLPAGFLFMPDGLANGDNAEAEMTAEGEEPLEDDATEAFEERIHRALAAPLTDETSPESLLPTILRGAPELGAAIKHISLAQAIDPNHNNAAEVKLNRLLAGLDIPKDVAAGLSGVKYSNAILIEEQLYKAHIEPLILLIVDCLTTAFFRPALLAQGLDPALVSRTTIWYDPSMITAKPSKAEASTTGYEIGAVSKEAWRRNNGFSNSDAPSQLETLQRFGMEKGMLNDATTEMIVQTLIPKEMQEKLREDSLAASDPAAVESLTNALDGTDFEPLPGAAATPASPTGEAPAGLVEP